AKVSLTDLKIHHTSGSGIHGDANGARLAGFIFHKGTIHNSDTGGAVDGSNIAFNNVTNANETNVTGIVSITNNVLTNSRYHGVDIQQFGGTITRLNISGNKLTSRTSGTNSIGSEITVGIQGPAPA